MSISQCWKKGLPSKYSDSMTIPPSSRYRSPRQANAERDDSKFFLVGGSKWIDLERPLRGRGNPFLHWHSSFLLVATSNLRKVTGPSPPNMKLHNCLLRTPCLVVDFLALGPFLQKKRGEAPLKVVESGLLLFCDMPPAHPKFRGQTAPVVAHIPPRKWGSRDIYSTKWGGHSKFENLQVAPCIPPFPPKQKLTCGSPSNQAQQVAFDFRDLGNRR